MRVLYEKVAKVVLDLTKTSQQLLKKYKFLFFIFLQIIILTIVYFFYSETDFSKALTFFAILNFIFSFLSFALQIFEKVDSKIESSSRLRIFLVKQLDVFRNSSIAFDLFILFTAIQIYRYSNLYAQEQALLLESVKKSNEELKIDYKKLEDSVYVTQLKLEKQKYINLKLEESISPRSLTNHNLSDLRKFSGTEYYIRTVGTVDQMELKDQIDDILEHSGWVKRGNESAVFGTQFREGITIHVNQDSTTQKNLIEAANALRILFQINKIDAKIFISKGSPFHQIRIDIGKKPWKPILEINDAYPTKK